MLSMQGALITAYKDYEMLRALIQNLNIQGVQCFVHVDRKANYSIDQMRDLEKIANVIPVRFKIHWGSYSHLLAIVELMKFALQSSDLQYFHILSGQDLPVRKIGYFDNSSAIFLDVESLEGASDLVKNRVTYRKLFYFIESPRILYRLLNKISLVMQRILCIKRRGSRVFGEVFKGLIWSSFPRCFAEHLVFDDKSVEFLRELKDYYVPEEYFLQTIAMNSKFSDKVMINNRRFSLWVERYGTIPAILDASDYVEISKGDYLFARKIDSTISRDLMKLLGFVC